MYSGRRREKRILFIAMIKKRNIQRPGVRMPVAALDTIRHKLIVELTDGPLSARDISGRIGVSEKEVYDHLEHVRKTLHRLGRILIVKPAECFKCGFIFEKRKRLKKPGKCPLCRSEFIYPPLFSIGEEL